MTRRPYPRRLLGFGTASWAAGTSQIADLAGLPSGTVHPILARLEGRGWLDSRWEDVDPRVQGRPARRYYRLTGAGVESARAALQRAYRPTTVRPRLRPATGQS